MIEGERQSGIVEWIYEILTIIRNGILKAQQEAESEKAIYEKDE